MTRLALTIAFALLTTFTLRAEGSEETPKRPRTDANVTGHVESAQTLEHLPDITITVKGTTLATATDATGHYALRDLPVGNYTLTASAAGYGTAETQVELAAGKTIEVNFLLDEEAISMDQVVITSSRNAASKKGSATIVNVASAQLFNKVSPAALSDAMNFQPGLRVEMTCGNCGVPQLRINGLEGQYSQILLDGQPVFSSLAAVYGLEQMPVAMVERVEVIRGGGSALFGANAIGGVVNIITREPLRNTLSLSNTTAVYGKGGGTDIVTSLGGSFVSDDLRAGAYIFGMLRDRSAYDRNGDGFSDIPLLKSEMAGIRGYFRTSTRSRLTYEYHRMHEFRRGGDNLSSPPHEALIAEQLEHNINGGSLRYDFATYGNRHRLGIYTSAQGIARKSYFGAGLDPNAYGRTDDLVANAGTQYTWGMERLLFMPSELTAGFEYTHNKLEDNYFHRQHEVSQKIDLFGGYVQNEWKNDKWGILIGARLDKHSLMDKPVFSPRANLRYTPGGAVSLRLSWSSGYRAPQTYDEDLHVTAVSEKVSLIHNAAGLRPEYSNSVSASADLYHNFGRLQTNLLVEGFYTDIRDAFELVTTAETDDFFVIERRNSAGLRVAGANFELRMGIPRVFDFQAGFTAQRSRYNEPADWVGDDVDDSKKPAAQSRLLRSPDRYGYFTAGFDITRRFTASLFGTYTGPMIIPHVLPDPDDPDGAIYRNERSPDFFDMGTKLAYTFAVSRSISLEVSGGVKNIFDSFQSDIDAGETKDAGYIYGPTMPRMYFFGARLSF